MAKLLEKCRPTDAWVRLALVPVLAFVALAGDRNYLADFWHHLARGKAIVTDGRLLDHDIFTFTVPGQPFQDVNWLSQVFYSHLFHWGGLALVQVVNALLVALMLGWLVLLCRRRSGSLPAALAVGIFTFLGLWNVLTIRPQTFSLLLFVATLDVLERSERQPWLLTQPPLFLGLWANLHGAFPAGLMLVGCHLLAQAVTTWRGGRFLRDQRIWALAGCLVACVLATLANPYGWNIYLYVGQTSGRAAARRIDEWVPPSFDHWIGIAFFVSLVLLAGLLWLNWKKARQAHRPRPVGGDKLPDLFLGLCFLPLASGSVRMVVWWLLALAPAATVLLARLLPAPDPQAERKPNRGAALAFGVLLIVALTSVPGLQVFNPLLRLRPQERTEHDLDAIHAKLLEHGQAGNVFSRLEWGEYLGWTAAPRFKVFMDGRIEIFPDKVWQEYAAVTQGDKEWPDILDRYGVAALVLDADFHARTGLLEKVDGSPGWRRVFKMRNAVLYLRKPGEVVAWGW